MHSRTQNIYRVDGNAPLTTIEITLACTVQVGLLA